MPKATSFFRPIFLSALTFSFYSCIGMGVSSHTYDHKKTKNAQGETVETYYKTTLPTFSVSRPDSYVPYTPSSPRDDFFSNPKPLPVVIKGPTTPPPTSTSFSNEAAIRLFVGYFEMSASDEHLHLGGHLGINIHDIIVPRLGLSLFYSNDAYMGLDASVRGYLPFEDFKPFAGVGVFGGSVEQCHSVSYYTEKCERKELGTGYTEFGVEFKKIGIFYRNYNIDRAGINIPDAESFGVTFRF